MSLAHHDTTYVRAIRVIDVVVVVTRRVLVQRAVCPAVPRLPSGANDVSRVPVPVFTKEQGKEDKRVNDTRNEKQA